MFKHSNNCNYKKDTTQSLNKIIVQKGQGQVLNKLIK